MLPAALATTGLATGLAALQALALLTPTNAWLAAWPKAELMLGLLVAAAAYRVATLGRAARILALLTLLPLTAASWPWAWLLLQNGFLSLSAWMVPASATLSLLLLAWSWRALGEVETTVKALHAEAAALAADDPDAFAEPMAPPGLPNAVVAIAALLGLPLLALLLAIASPAAFATLETRVRGVLAGRSLFDDAFVERADRYPYSGSPLRWYVETERRFAPVDVEQAVAFGDDIARDVAWALSAETGTAEANVAERALWSAGKAKLLPEWIAAALRRRGVFYHEESLFSRSFDPKLHLVPGAVHMDCDQLVYVFLHVASKLDLAMVAMPAPMHLYLRYSPPAGLVGAAAEPLTVETTQFRPLQPRGDDGNGGDLERTDAHFFIDADFHRRGEGGTWASRDLAEAANLFAPATERDLRDAIAANVLVGVRAAGLPVDFIAASEAHLEGTRDITLVANLYGERVKLAQAALEADEREQAQAHALAARELRRRFGPLVVSGRKPEEEILDQLEAAEPAP